MNTTRTVRLDKRLKKGLKLNATNVEAVMLLDRVLPMERPVIIVTK